MSHFFKKTTLLFTLLLTLFINIFSGFAQEQTLSKDAFISVLNCDSGNELYSLFGHTAIRVSDPANDIDVVYNYGTFDFDTPNFYLKFTKGDLQYFVSTSTYDEFVNYYRYLQRGVFEQKLNLTQEQKQAIANELETSLLPENRYYTYKFIDRNCTTMVVDMVQKHLNDKLYLKVKGSDQTYRTILFGYLKTHFYENLGISILFGAKTDQPFGKIFLPMQFLESIAHSKNGEVALSDSTQTVNINSLGEAPMSLWNNCYTYVLALLLIVLVNKRWLTFGWFILMGLLGTFMLFAGFYSFHLELEQNYNVMLFNPLLLLTVWMIAKNRYASALKIIYVNLALLAVYVAVMFNKAHFLLFLPMIVANAALMGRMAFQFRKK